MTILAAGGLFLVPSYAAHIDAPPPSINDAPDNIEHPNAKTVTSEERITHYNKRSEGANNSEKADREQSKKDLEDSKVRTSDTSMWPKKKIEETVDNNNRVTEVKVTPMSTQIPYVMKRELPSNKTPGQNNEGSLSVPKFINFGF